MNIARFSVHRPVFVTVIIVAILLIGAVVLPTLPIDLLPPLQYPATVVITSDPGAAPGEVETLVTDPIEGAVGTVPGVTSVQSTSQANVSTVIVQFGWGTDMNFAELKLREKLDQVRPQLPDSAQAPQLMTLDPNALPVVTLALEGNSGLTQVASVADQTVRQRLARVDGVASIQVQGGQARQVKVALDPAKLATYGISVSQVAQALSAQNLSASAATVDRGSGSINVEVGHTFQNAQEIGQIPIPISAPPASSGTPSQPAQATVPLNALGRVIDGYADPSQYTYVNGKPAVVLSVQKSSTANTVRVAADVERTVRQLNDGQLPAGVHLSTVLNQADYINLSIRTVAQHAAIGGIVAIVVLFFFLGSLRSTLAVLVMLPVSLIGAFALMYFSGQGINMLSLGGLALGLGSLLDFAIVVLENIYRHRQEGMGAQDGAIVGAGEVVQAVIASALCQIAVFVPMLFVGGIATELFRPLALAVIFSHVMALLGALTFVPMLVSRWLPDQALHRQQHPRHPHHPVVAFGRAIEWLKYRYGQVLRWALGHPWRVILTTVVLLAACGVGFTRIPTEFIPQVDQGQVTVSITLPNDAKLEQTQRIADQIEARAMEIPAVQTVYTSVGSAGGAAALIGASLGQGSPNEASVQLQLVPLSQRSISSAQVAEQLQQAFDELPGVQVNASAAGLSSVTGSPLQVTLYGPDTQTLRQLGSQAQQLLEKVPGVSAVHSSLGETRAQLEIKLDPQRLMSYGLTPAQVVDQVRSAFNGQTATQLKLGDTQIDVVVQVDPREQHDRNALEQLPVVTPMGTTIALASLGSVSTMDQPTTVVHDNQVRAVQLPIDLKSGAVLGTVTSAAEQALQGLSLPDGYGFDIGGQAEQMNSAFRNLTIAIVLSIALLYLIMAALFESFFYPLVVLFSLPGTFIGVVVGLLVTRQPLSVTALIGVLMLIGIVMNNAIVLVDYINRLRRQSLETDEAIAQAGPIRLRPILMTALATVLALVPLAVAGGEGSELLRGLAIVVGFGLTLSTLVTLLLVPVIYQRFDHLGNFLRHRRRTAPSSHPPVTPL